MTTGQGVSAETLRARYDAALASFSDEQRWALRHMFAAAVQMSFSRAGADLRLARQLEAEAAAVNVDGRTPVAFPFPI